MLLFICNPRVKDVRNLGNEIMVVPIVLLFAPAHLFFPSYLEYKHAVHFCCVNEWETAFFVFLGCRFQLYSQSGLENGSSEEILDY